MTLIVGAMIEQRWSGKKIPTIFTDTMGTVGDSRIDGMVKHVRSEVTVNEVKTPITFAISGLSNVIPAIETFLACAKIEDEWYNTDQRIANAVMQGLLVDEGLKAYEDMRNDFSLILGVNESLFWASTGMALPITNYYCCGSGGDEAFAILNFATKTKSYNLDDALIQEVFNTVASRNISVNNDMQIVRL